MPNVTCRLAVKAHTVDVGSFTVRPDTSMNDVVGYAKQAAFRKLNLHVNVISVNGSDNQALPNWQGQRLVGSSDVTVETEAVDDLPTQTVLHFFDDLYSEVTGLKSEVTGLKSEVTGLKRMVERSEARKLQMTTAEILNRALDGDFRGSAGAGSRFRGLDGQEPRIVSLSSFTGWSPQQILALADRVVTERNLLAHSSTLAYLEAQVQECLAAIEDMSSLERLCPDECWVLKNFVHIRAAFQPNLGTL